MLSAPNANGSVMADPWHFDGLIWHTILPREKAAAELPVRNSTEGGYPQLHLSHFVAGAVGA